MSFIEAQSLSKTYIRHNAPKEGGISRLWKRETQHIEALADASFTIEQGELVGLIGPNGAGKSTTVKLLTGILTPTSGSCTVDGRTPWANRQEHVRRLGAVFGQRTQLWWDVPIRDSFLLLRDIYDIDNAVWQRRLDALVDALELGEFLNAPLRQLSLGQRMRAELCGSLLHAPKLLFLDEPTIGLDAVSKLKLRAFLREENRQNGTTILLTTHDMEDMLALSNRVMVLGRGRLLYDGALDALLQKYDTVHTLRVMFEEAPDVSVLPADVKRDGDALRVLSIGIAEGAAPAKIVHDGDTLRVLSDGIAEGAAPVKIVRDGDALRVLSNGIAEGAAPVKIVRDGDTLRVLSDGIAEGAAPVKIVRDGDAFILTYEPAKTPTSVLLPQVLAAGRVREMTLKEQNVDELIARMYKELAL